MTNIYDSTSERYVAKHISFSILVQLLEYFWRTSLCNFYIFRSIAEIYLKFMYNFCSLLENDFCHDIVECILTFNVEASSSKKNKVLLFPPLTARGRYLIHKCAETTSFSSLSVGLEPCRRVVVYKRNTSGKNDLTQPRFDPSVSYFNFIMPVKHC